METRQRLLAAAGELFAAQGFDGTSTRQVATAAGANIATIAYHFGGKQGLYEATLGRMYERLLELEIPALPEHERDARIRAVMALLWHFCRREQQAVRLLLRHVLEQGSLPEVVREQWSTRTLQRALELQIALELPNLDGQRLVLLSLNHLLARYAVSSTADLRPFVGSGDSDQAIADHLGDVAVALFALSPSSAADRPRGLI